MMMYNAALFLMYDVIMQSSKRQKITDAYGSSSENDDIVDDDDTVEEEIDKNDDAVDGEIVDDTAEEEIAKKARTDGGNKSGKSYYTYVNAYSYGFTFS